MEVAGYIVVDSTEKQRGQFQQCEGEDLQHKLGELPKGSKSISGARLKLSEENEKRQFRRGCLVDAG
jgi:hypothetical protein